MKAREELDEELKRYVYRHQSVWEIARLQVEEIEEEVQEMRKPFEEEIRRLETIPGVGPITAMTAIAVLSTITRFPTAKHAASYAGLVPSVYDSGERQRHGHITKRGSGELRAMLVECAQHARCTRHPLHPYFSELAGKKGYKIAVIAVANRLLRIIVAMLKTESDFDVKKLNVEARIQKVTRTRYWHKKLEPSSVDARA